MRMRSRGRALALQALYCMATHSQSADTLAEEADWRLDVNTSKQQEYQFALLLIRGVLDNFQQINEIICAHIYNWSFNRLLEIDKAILRLSVYSLLHLTNIPVAVTINEAIELAKQYSDEHSPQFINGILDNCAKQYCVTV